MCSLNQINVKNMYNISIFEYKTASVIQELQGMNQNEKPNIKTTMDVLRVEAAGISVWIKISGWEQR
jgi:nucleoid-associated protein YejK